MSQIFKNKLQSDLITVIACSVFADKEALMNLWDDKRYVRNVIGQFKTEKLVIETRSSPKMLRLKKRVSS